MVRTQTADSTAPARAIIKTKKKITEKYTKQKKKNIQNKKHTKSEKTKSKTEEDARGWMRFSPEIRSQLNLITRVIWYSQFINYLLFDAIANDQTRDYNP